MAESEEENLLDLDDEIDQPSGDAELSPEKLRERNRAEALKGRMMSRKEREGKEDSDDERGQKRASCQRYRGESPPKIKKKRTVYYSIGSHEVHEASREKIAAEKARAMAMRKEFDNKMASPQRGGVKLLPPPKRVRCGVSFNDFSYLMALNDGARLFQSEDTGESLTLRRYGHCPVTSCVTDGCTEDDVRPSTRSYPFQLMFGNEEEKFTVCQEYDGKTDFYGFYEIDMPSIDCD